MMSNGAVVAPGSHRPKNTDPPRCPIPFDNMIVASTHEATRAPGAARLTAGVKAASTTISTINPDNQTPKVNVGTGQNPSHSRMLRTNGL